MQKPPKYSCEFGPFRLDPVNRILTRGGEIVPLKPKIFDTLSVLVEQPGQVLSKADLMERIWPDTAVEENNLSQNISVLRKVLGKDPNGQDYIKTIPKRGYCFTANVQEVWEEGADFILEKSSRSRIIVEEEQDTPDRRGEDAAISIMPEASGYALALEPRRFRWSRRRTLTAISLAVAAVIIAVVGWILFYQPRKRNDSGLLSSLSIVRIADWKSGPRRTGLRNGAFSPDGKMITFSSSKNEHSGIWVKQVEGGEAFEVFWDDWYNEGPIWSPDQNRIAFVSNRGGHFGIWSIPSFGGTLVLLSPLQDGGWPELKRWSKSETIYYELEGNLFALDLNSKQTTQVTNFDPAVTRPSTFSISPGEDLIAYACTKNGQRDIWVMALAGGEPTQVTNDLADDRDPVWDPLDKSIIYSSYREDGYRICIAYLDGRPSERIPLEDIGNYISDISPDGSKILFVQAREDADLFKVQVDTGEETELTSDFGLELWPAISPDGKTIAYQAARGKVEITKGSIFSKQLDGAGRQLQLAANGFDPRWSPGGDLGFLRFENGSYNIWTVKAIGGEQRKLTADDVIVGGFSGLPYDRSHPRDYNWSPDGGSIAYCSLKPGPPNVRVVAADGSSNTVFSNNTDPTRVLYCPTWSPDGGRIAYFAASRAPGAEGKFVQSVWVAEPGKSEPIFNSNASLRLIGWSESGHSVIVAVINEATKQQPTAQVDLLEIPVNAGASRKIVSFSSAYLNSIQLSPDRRSVAIVARPDGRDNIWVFSGGDGKIKKISKNTDARLYFSGLAWSPDGRAIYCDKLSSWSFISMIDNFRRKDQVSWRRTQNQAE